MSERSSSMPALLQVLRHHWPVFVIGGVIVYGLWSGAGGRGGATSKLEGQLAPEFTLPVVTNGAEETSVALADLRGKVVVLDFWASWCGPCQRAARESNLARQAVAGENVVFYGINVEPNLAPIDLRRAHADFGYAFPTLQDRTGAVQSDYRVSSLPTTVIIGPDGAVRQAVVGAIDSDSIEAEIRKVLR